MATAAWPPSSGGSGSMLNRPSSRLIWKNSTSMNGGAGARRRASRSGRAPTIEISPSGLRPLSDAGPPPTADAGAPRRGRRGRCPRPRRSSPRPDGLKNRPSAPTLPPVTSHISPGVCGDRRTDADAARPWNSAVVPTPRNGDPASPPCVLGSGPRAWRRSCARSPSRSTVNATVVAHLVGRQRVGQVVEVGGRLARRSRRCGRRSASPAASAALSSTTSPTVQASAARVGDAAAGHADHAEQHDADHEGLERGATASRR